MHPVIDEFCRIYSLSNYQSLSFRRHQRLLRDEVQPLLDEREKLIEENHQLREQLAVLQAETPKRGRPRKADAEAVPA